MATVFEDCQQALEEHLLLLPEIPLRTDDGEPAVAWENTEYSPETGQLWLRPKTFFREHVEGAIGNNGTRVLRGTFYVPVLTPGGIGAASGNELAGALVRHFATGTTLVAMTGDHKVRIRRAWRESAIVENAGWFLVPVLVDWYCHTHSL